MSETKPDNDSLILHLSQQLSIRTSLVLRGLQHVIQHRIPAIAWSRPNLVGTLSNTCELGDSDNPPGRFMYFSCRLKNINESGHNLSEGVAILRRSRTTGAVSSVPGDGFGFPASRIFFPPKHISPTILVGLSVQRGKALEECLAELFRESCELLAYDEKFHTVIVIPLDQPDLLGFPAPIVKMARILVVDDEEPIRATIRDMLISAGYECSSVPSGVDALSLLESGEKFELLLNDLLNSPMDGITLLVRAQEKFPNLPVIIVSAVHGVDVALAAQRSGASDYLLKPFEREQLLTIVRQVLACRNQPKRAILPWKLGLSTMIAPALEDQSVIRTQDGKPRLIRDLSPGDMVAVKHGNDVQVLLLYEDGGSLAATDFVPDKGGHSIEHR